jgi:hypothetical protein
MRLSRLLLFLAGLAVVFICVAPSWAGKIPSKRPSDFGDSTSDVQLDTPTFAPINQNGVTLDLNSVFCNSCSLPTSPTNLEYFFDINLASGASLTSLTFGPGFDTTDLSNFGIVQFDPTDPANAGDPCVSGTTYVCSVPFTSSSLDFSTVTSAITCAVDGSCTVDFTNFNFATLGSGNIILAATVGFGQVSVLADPTTGEPLTPSVAINGASTTVPEPNSLWFVGIAGVACLAGIVRRKRITPSVQAC